MTGADRVQPMTNINAKAGAMLPLTRSFGFWMACAMALSQGANAARAFIDPTSFATYMGIPSQAAELHGWVQIYGLRAGFIALLVSVFLLRKELIPLKWMAICGIVLPLGDAWVAAQAGAPTVIVGRHLGIAAFLCLAAFMLARDVAARAGRD